VAWYFFSESLRTKDNVSIDIAAVAYYHISDPEKAVIAIENVYNAINQISQTTVRNVVGRFSLDQLLSDTASINETRRSLKFCEIDIQLLAPGFDGGALVDRLFRRSRRG
jgi:SPFH domain / Band 7 family